MAAAPAGGTPNAPPAESLPEFKAPTVSPPTAPQGADAAYNEQVGKIEFQLNNQLAGDKETFTNARTTYNYNKALYAQKLPEEVGTQRFRAALGGFANSGTEARNQGRIQAGFVNKNTANLTRFTEAANRANRQAGEQVGNRGFAIAGQQREAERRYKNQQVKLNPQEPQPITVAGGGPPGSRVTAGPGSPGQPIRAGFATAEYGVGQGTDKPMRGTRLAAANKARKR